MIVHLKPKHMKLLSLIALIAGMLLLNSCGLRSDDATLGTELENPTEQAFFNNLAQLCGQSFEGQQEYMREGRESWEDMHFVMHATVCENDSIYLPFHIDDDHSRTWMFLVEDGKLRFRHDHRDPDGTPQRSTMYGGYADDNGTAFRQYFPADDYTIDNRLSSPSSVWIVELAEDMSTYSYSLHAGDTKIFKASFDLTNPL